MPIDFSILGKEGRLVEKEWKSEIKKHNSYAVKNKFHKERKMDDWNAKLNSMNADYRKKLKSIEKVNKARLKEIEQMRK